MQANRLTEALIFSLLLAAFSTEAAADDSIKWGKKFFPLHKTESTGVTTVKNAGAITARNGSFFSLAAKRVNTRTAFSSRAQSTFRTRQTASAVAPKPTFLKQPEVEIKSQPIPTKQLPVKSVEETEIDEELPAEIAGSDEYQKAIKSILPTLTHAWPFEKGTAERITSAFGWRRHPVTETRAFHQGIDIAAAVGTDVLASADGVVASTGEHKNLGRFVKILHGDGSYSVYGHLKNWVVKTGELVEQGKKIAEIGMTGRTTGPHLHYSIVVDGKAANPLKFLRKNLPDSQVALVM